MVQKKGYCTQCCNCQGTKEMKLMHIENYPAVECKLFQNMIFTESDMEARGCEYHNKDLSKEKICGNCKYYLGGGDWGLSCSKDYYKLPQAISKACKDFEAKENED